MNQEKIKYRDIIGLGFTEEMQNDTVYKSIYGYPYTIITKDLTQNIYLDWAKETQLCKLVRIDNPEDCNVMAEMPIRNLKHLEEIIWFFV